MNARTRVTIRQQLKSTLRENKRHYVSVGFFFGFFFFQGCLKVRTTVRFDGSETLKRKKNENCGFLAIRILKLRVGVLNKNQLD